MAQLFGGPAVWTLALDASTYAGTVAVLRGGDVVVDREVAMRAEREERLLPAVADALAQAGIVPSMLDAVVCGAGPGSFTSLRIAASIAKGLAHATGRPLYAAPSLALLVTAQPSVAGARYLAVLDALRGESYAAVVTLADGAHGPATSAARAVVGYEYLGVVDTARLPELLRAYDAVRVQPTVPGATGEGVAPRARGVAALAQLLAESGPVDLDSWEPNYGRKAEAQVKWEAAHGRALPVDAGTTS